MIPGTPRREKERLWEEPGEKGYYREKRGGGKDLSGHYFGLFSKEGPPREDYVQGGPLGGEKQTNYRREEVQEQGEKKG